MQTVSDRSRRLAGWGLIWAAAAFAIGLAAAGIVHGELARPGVQLLSNEGRLVGIPFTVLIAVHGVMISLVPALALIAAGVSLAARRTALAPGAVWVGRGVLTVSVGLVAALLVQAAPTDLVKVDHGQLVELWRPVLTGLCYLLLAVIVCLLAPSGAIVRWVRGAFVLTCLGALSWLVLSDAFDVFAVSETSGDDVFQLDHRTFSRVALLLGHRIIGILSLIALILHFLSERWSRDPAWIYGVIGLVLVLVHDVTTAPINVFGGDGFGGLRDTQAELVPLHGMGGVLITFTAYIVAFRWIEALGCEVSRKVTWLHASLLAVSLFASIAPFALLGMRGMPRRYFDYPEAFSGENAAGAVIGALMIALHVWGMIRIARAARSRSAEAVG